MAFSCLSPLLCAVSLIATLFPPRAEAVLFTRVSCRTNFGTVGVIVSSPRPRPPRKSVMRILCPIAACILLLVPATVRSDEQQPEKMLSKEDELFANCAQKTGLTDGQNKKNINESELKEASFCILGCLLRQSLHAEDEHGKMFAITHPFLSRFSPDQMQVMRTCTENQSATSDGDCQISRCIRSEHSELYEQLTKLGGGGTQLTSSRQ